MAKEKQVKCPLVRKMGKEKMLSNKVTYICLRKRNHKKKKIFYNKFLGCKLLQYLSINQMRQVDQVIVQWPMLRAGAKYQIRYFHFWMRLTSTCVMEHDIPCLRTQSILCTIIYSFNFVLLGNQHYQFINHAQISSAQQATILGHSLYYV